jgi:hypothetical protein
MFRGALKKHLKSLAYTALFVAHVVLLARCLGRLGGSRGPLPKVAAGDLIPT